jgi:acetyl esterase/lipase
MNDSNVSLLKMVDPELIESRNFVVKNLAFDFMATLDAPSRRNRFEEFAAGLGSPETIHPEVIRHDLIISGYSGDPDVRIRLLRRKDQQVAKGGILYMHGGGFTIGSVEQEDWNAAGLAASLGCTVISVDYRLAPENPHPAPIRDCYAALCWMHANADQIMLTPTLIAVYGHSAGGNLATNLTLMTRDLKGPELAYQMLCYPMLDDRMATQSMTELSGLGIWDKAANAVAWTALLGRLDGPILDYAVPARSSNLKGLPPTFIDTGALEILLDEMIEYGRRLIEAHVPFEFHLYPSAYHGFDMFAPAAAVSQRATSVRLAALRRSLKLSD